MQYFINERLRYPRHSPTNFHIYRQYNAVFKMLINLPNTYMI